MWLKLPSFTQMVDPATFARGLQVFRAQQARTLDIVWIADAHWHLIGLVSGTQRQPYRVVVDVHLMPDGTTLDRWQGRCTCPVGVQCKHAVALMLKAAYQGQPLADAARQRAGAAELASLSPEERKRLAEQRQREQVLAEQQRLRHLQEQAAERWLRGEPDTAGSASARAAPTLGMGRNPESPVYLIQHQDNDGRYPRLRLYLGTSSLKLKGGWSKPRPVGPRYFTQQRHGYRDRDIELTDADSEALDLLGALPPSSKAFYNYTADTDWPLDGIAAPMVLARAAATGRLFWRESGGALGAAIAWGPEQWLQWKWETQPGPTPVAA
jgi:hypothetical protein